MSARTRSMKQDATYYAPASKDRFNQTTFASPVAITCRWENKNTLFIDKEGREVTSEAVVYTSQELTLGGYLYEGTSTALTPPAGSREIRGKAASPNLRDSEVLNKVFL